MNLSEVSVRGRAGEHTLEIGGESFTYMASAGDTAADVLEKACVLVQAGSGGLSATADTATVAATHASLIGRLVTLINEGETAFTASADGAVLRLTADADNTAFSFQGAAVGDPAGLASNGVDPDVEAAPGVSQVNVIEFETLTGTSSVNGDVVVVIDGAVFEAAGVTLTNTTAQPALSAPTVDASATTTVTSPTLSSNATRTISTSRLCRSSSATPTSSASTTPIRTTAEQTRPSNCRC